MKQFAKQSVTFNKAARHTDIIGIGNQFNDSVGNYNDMIKMLKQTGHIFSKSGLENIFKDVKHGRNVIETTENYLGAIQKYNTDRNNYLFFYIEKFQKDFSLNIETSPQDSSTLYHMYLDFLPILEKEYPNVYPLFVRCLLTLHNRYSLMYDASYYCSSEQTAEKISERIYDPESYNDPPEYTKHIKKLYKHYDRYEYEVSRLFRRENSKYYRPIEIMIDELENRSGCNYPKLELLNEWFDLFLNILKTYPDKDLLVYEQKCIEETERYNDCSFEDMCESGIPIMIRDSFALSWWGDSDSCEDIVQMMGDYAGNFGELTIFEKFKAYPGGRIPESIINSSKTNFIKDLIDLIILGNNVRDRFITKKYEYLI